MFAANAYEEKMRMACGHEQFNKVRYHSARQHREQQSDFATMICNECRAQIRQWMAADHGKDLFAMDLPQITGTPKMVKWAVDLRKARYEKYGPLMLVLSKMVDNDLAKATWKALYLTMMVTDSKHWIDNRAPNQFTDLNLSYEVSNLMKDPGSNRAAVMGNSSFAYFRDRNPIVLQRIALFDVAILPTVDVMPTIYY